MADSKFDSRPGGSKFDSRSGVSSFDSRLGTSCFDSRPGTRSNEFVFRGKSPPAVYKLLLLAIIAGGFAWAFAGSIDFRTWLRVDRNVAPWAASLCGGAATILLVCVAWSWYYRIKWVAVSEQGIRWLRGPRAKFRRWDQYVGIERGSVEMTVWGEDLKTGRYAEFQFRNGSSLTVSTHTVFGFEDLIAEIQLMVAQNMRNIALIPDSQGGLNKPSYIAYGPLRMGEDGLKWDRIFYGWDEVEEYEVGVGFLRIQSKKGTEFVRRLTDLGDWESALTHLESRLGAPQRKPESKSRSDQSAQAAVAVDQEANSREVAVAKP
jgi:hypothetical protein